MVDVPSIGQLSGTRPGSEFCSTRDAAERLGVSIKTAQSWVESGVLRAWKTPGGHRRIHRDSVDALLRERTRPGRGASAARQPFSILAVDDNRELLRLYELNIAQWGLPVRIRTAASGFETLVRIGEEPPQLLLADLSMQGLDGFRLLRWLRAIRAYDTMHIVIVTHLSTYEIRERGGLPDDVVVFAKPVVFERLKQRIESLVGTSASAAHA